MKILLAFLLSFSSTVTWAHEYTFTTPGQGSALTFKAKANDEYKAREIAAEKCFDHFTRGQGVSNEYGEQVINICTNMRQK